MSVNGKIHSFETFGTLDGPGIRFVIFMQGCNFKCKYCHNPDTWACGLGQNYSAFEVMEKITRFKPYFQKSGGGITVSGGEPLLQPEFLIELFKECKKEKIHIAIDTNGSVKLDEKTIELLGLVDLVLLDIKHMDNASHMELTGLSNDKTIEFAKYLNLNKIPVWLRYVIVPGLTDDEFSLKRLGNFISTLNNISKIELLPFHKTGEYKWEELNLKYDLSDTPAATDEDIKRVRKILKL